MSQALIPILVFLAVVGLGGAVLLAQAIRSRWLQQRLYGRHDSRHETRSKTSGLTSAIDHLGRAITPEKPDQGLRQELVQAGYYAPSAQTSYLGAQLLLTLASLVIGLLLAFALDLSLSARVSVAVGVVAGFALLPKIFIIIRRRRRAAEVRRTLPDAIDLLEICVASGMGLDMAWNAVADEIRGVSSILADEMALANLEIHLGAARADALRNMGRRTGVEDLSSLVATLVQSERFGTSIGQALRVYADTMRAERSHRAESAAEQLMVKLMFPMVVFIFPCIFIVILGPAAIRIAAMFNKG